MDKGVISCTMTPYPKVRSGLPAWLVENGFKVGAEVGVYKGEFTEMLCDAGLKVYAVDPWAAYSREHRQEIQDSLYGHAQKQLKKYTNCTIVRKSSMEAVKDFADESLDFVYIDGDHSYTACLEDITEWAKKVRKGGMVSGHDYKGRSSLGVKQAVDEYVKEHNSKLILIATRGYMKQRGDKFASFLWIKE